MTDTRKTAISAFVFGLIGTAIALVPGISYVSGRASSDEVAKIRERIATHAKTSTVNTLSSRVATCAKAGYVNDLSSRITRLEANEKSAERQLKDIKKDLRYIRQSLNALLIHAQRPYHRKRRATP